MYKNSLKFRQPWQSILPNAFPSWLAKQFDCLVFYDIKYYVFLPIDYFWTGYVKTVVLVTNRLVGLRSRNFAKSANDISSPKPSPSPTLATGPEIC